ncbi:MAG TPA: hypothetical protein PLZ11_14575, partial [Thauera sp.]|nr:hypothetical protein [Thauera sp.]
ISLRRPPKVRSVWRAVLAGVVAQPLVVLLLTVAYWALRPFVWAAVYSEPYRPPPGPYPPDSGEWLFVQGIGFCASLVAGAAAAHWSPQGSKLPVGILVGFSFIGLLFTQFPLETSAIRNVIYAVGVPLGIVVGAVIRWRREAKEEDLQ